MGDAGKTALFGSFFPHVLEIAQPNLTRKDAAADGNLRTLSRIDRAFITLHMAESRDFHCFSHVTDNLGERSRAIMLLSNSRAETDRALRQSQANPELDVQTSCVLHHFEADQ